MSEKFSVSVDSRDLKANLDRLIVNGISFSCEMNWSTCEATNEPVWVISVAPDIAEFLLAGLVITF